MQRLILQRGRWGRAYGMGAVLGFLVVCLPIHRTASVADETHPAATADAVKGDAKVGSKSSKTEETSDTKATSEPSEKIAVDPKLVEEPVRAILSGKVVLLSEALARRDIKAYAEELRGQIVLETNDGRLVPIVPDWRGRALYQDARLRDRPVDLLVRQRKSIPQVQVLSIYTFDEKGVRQLTDYWCDICSIPMYEIKDCECCQGPIRLRFQPKELPADLAPGSKAPETKPEQSQSQK